jgi:hypothetical protein
LTPGVLYEPGFLYALNRSLLCAVRGWQGDGQMASKASYVESGTHFALTYGDIDDAFYTSLESVLRKMIALLQTPEGAAIYPMLADPCEALRSVGRDIGRGYGVAVDELLSRLQAGWGRCVVGCA